MNNPGPMDDESVVDIGHYFRVLARRKWVVILGVLLGLAAGALVSSASSDSYQSSADVVVQAGPGSQAQGVHLTSDTDIYTQAELATSAPVAEIAAKKLGHGTRARTLMGNTTVTPSNDALLLTFGYIADDANLTRDRAQAMANAFLSYRTSQAKAALGQLTSATAHRVSDLRGQLRDIDHQLNSDEAGSSQERNDLLKQRQIASQLLTQENQYSDYRGTTIASGTLIKSASRGAPTSKVSPSILLAAGLLLGLLLGVLAAFLRDRTDRQVRGPEDLDRLSGLPLLAEPPSRRMRHLRAHSGPGIEPYDMLAARLLVDAKHGRGSVVTLLAPADAAASRRVAASVARALARRGTKVVLVDATTDPDVRRPIAVRDGMTLVSPPWNAENGLGPTSRLTPWFNELLAEHDFVLLAAPAVLADADALVLAAESDRSVLVVQKGHSRRADVTQSIERLEGVGASLAGLVLAWRIRPVSSSGAEPTRSSTPLADDSAKSGSHIRPETSQEIEAAPTVSVPSATEARETGTRAGR